MLRYLLPALILAAAPASSQHSRPTLTGRVSDAVSHEPLPSVTVMLADSTAGTATGADGRFLLAVPAGRCSLRVVLVGYTARLIGVDTEGQDSLELHVVLTPASVEGEEVAVIGERTPLTPLPALNAVTITPARAASISGAFRDAWRTVQALPGVASNNEMSSRFGVRGGATDQNLVLLNNTTLLDPFHLKESPNTSVSIVPLDLVSRLVFIPGGFPARYGGRLSAVMDMELRDGNSRRFAGQADASLTGAGIIAEGPLAVDASGIVSLRTTYADYISRYLPDGDLRRPQYFDLLAGAGATLAPGHRLSAHLLHAGDRTSGLASGSYATSMIALHAGDAVAEGDTLHTWLSLYRQHDDLSRLLGIFATDDRNATATRSTTLAGELKVRLEHRVSEAVQIVTGADISRTGYDAVQTDTYHTAAGDTSVTARLDRTVFRPALYVENHMTVDRLFINAGVRLDHAPAETRLSPRLLLSWRFPGGTRLKGAWGMYTQAPDQVQLLAASRAGLPDPQMERAMHLTLGVEQPLRRDLSFRVEAYLKTLDRLISYERLRSGEIVSSPRNDARGNIKGVEFEAAFSDERVFGWINVAVMRAEELNETDGRGWRLSPADQRKTVTTVFEFRLTDRISINLRAFYGSGFAYLNDDPGTPDLRLHYPEYKRADARVSYAVPVAGTASQVYLEILNLFAHRNAFSFTGGQKNPLTPDVNLLLPMIINAGVRVQW